MKKLSLLLIVFILAAGFVFAQEEAAEEKQKTEFFNLEVTIGFPVHWTTGLHDDTFYPVIPTGAKMEDRFSTANTAIGVALNFNFAKFIGLALDFDFFYAAKLNGISTAESDYISLSGMNLFFGPVIYLYNNNILRIPLALGFHMFYYNDDVWLPDLGAGNVNTGTWINRSEFQLGAGLYLGVQFHFNSSLYIFSRTNVAIDFVRIHKLSGYNLRDETGLEPTLPGADGSYADGYTEKSHQDIGNLHWSVKPTIGVGVKF